MFRLFSISAYDKFYVFYDHIMHFMIIFLKEQPIIEKFN